MLALSSVNINKYLFVVGSDVFVKSKGGESERIMMLHWVCMAQLFLFQISMTTQYRPVSLFPPRNNVPLYLFPVTLKESWEGTDPKPMQFTELLS